MERTMETEINLTEEEQVIINDLEEICEEELVFEEQMKAEKGSAIARSASPAIEAFRSFCNTDKDLAEYINSLTEKVKQKIENGEAKFEGEAIEQVYGELSKDIKKAFEDSAENEVERQKRSQDDEMKASMKFPPEKLFRDIIMELLVKQRKKQEDEKVPSVKKSEEVESEILKKGGEEVEKIEDRDQKIDDTLQEAGDGPEVIRVGEEGKEIVDESKDAENSLKKEAGEITDKDKGIDEMVESERDNERKKWQEKDDEEKKTEIENYKEKLDGELKAEGLLREKENIEDQIEKSREETVEFAEKTAEVAKKLQEQLEDGIDVSELEGLGQREAREIIKEIAKNTRNNLNTAKLEWLLKEENNPEDLMDTHKDRELTIINLQEMVDDIKKLDDYLDDYLEEFEKMSEEMKEETRKEALALADLVIEFAKDPKTIKILKAAGIITGLSILLIALKIGIPAGLAILAKNKFLVGAGAGTLGAGVLTKHFLSKKENRERLKEYGKVGAGGILGAGILALGWLLNGKKWEEFIKGVSKANYPDWYRFFEGLLGLKENETGKS